MLKIKTNNKPRPVLNWHELSTKQQKQIKKDNLLNEDVISSSFVFYKGGYYSLSEFIRVNDNPWVNFANDNLIVMQNWDGLLSEGYGFGVVIKMVDNQTCIMGAFYG